MSFLPPNYFGQHFGMGVPVFNPIAYGATGKGVAPDDVFIQVALDKAAAQGGGNVYLPRGTYLLQFGLQLYAHVRLIGDGIGETILKTVASGLYLFAPAGGKPGIIGTGGQDVVSVSSTNDAFLQNTGVYELTIDASGTHSIGGSAPGFQGVGLTFINIDNHRVKKVRIYNSASYGLQEGWVAFSGATPKTQTPLVVDNVFDSCGRETGADTIGGGVHNGARFQRNTFLNCYGNAWDNLMIDACDVSDNIIYSPQPRAAGRDASGRIQSDLGFNNGTICRNKFIGGTMNTPFLTTDAPAFGVPAGGILLGGGSGTSSHPPQNVVIADNVFFGSEVGIYCESAAVSGGPIGSTCSNITIKNNVFWSIFGRGPFNGNDFNSGICVADGDGIIVEGNVLRDWNASLTALTYTPNGAGQITAASDNWGILFKAASAASNGVTNSCVRNNVFKIQGNNVAQAGLWCEMWNSNNNTFENNTVEMNQVPVYIIRTKNQIGANLSILRNNNGISWANDIILPNVHAFPLPASGAFAVNQTGHDLIITVAGGTVSAIAINTVATGATAGSFFLKANSSIIITYTVAPTTWAPYPVTI